MRRTIIFYLTALTILVGFGLVLVYSASSQVIPDKPNYFVIRQSISLVISVIAAIAVSFIDYRFWSRRYVIIPLAVLLTMGAIAVFGFEKVNGSHRWINLGFYQVQPSEFSKIGVILALAAWLDRVGPRSANYVRGFLVPLLILAPLTIPILAAPDFGATVVILAIAGTIMLVAGTRIKHLLSGLALACAGFTTLLLYDPHRFGRVKDFFNSIVTDGGERPYQTTQAINAFILGGPLGAGLNQSIQKFYFLPEAHTDCIYAIAGEEMGLAASALIIALYGILLVCGGIIAFRAKDRFGRFVGIGVTILICFEAGFNIGMVLGCLPTKGLALPFLSYGGSSLMASLIAVGILLNIARQNIDNESNGMMAADKLVLHNI